MTLHGAVKRNEFGHTFIDSSSLAYKIWILENDWEDLFTCNPDHQNAKQVFNAMIL